MIQFFWAVQRFARYKTEVLGQRRKTMLEEILLPFLAKFCVPFLIPIPAAPKLRKIKTLLKSRSRVSLQEMQKIGPKVGHKWLFLQGILHST